MEIDPFHDGERAAQAKAGVQPFRSAIRDYLPDQHRQFFAGLRFLPLATVDESGWPVGTILCGPAGFVCSPDPHSLHIAACPPPDDPVALHLVAGAAVGMLGIDLSTRRRNRANGRIRGADKAGLTVGVTESFGNCPQYIQVRQILEEETAPQPVQRLAGLDAEACALIAGADTFFVASSVGAQAERGGVDISHRGGTPGFVRIEDETLIVPDFRGNRYFNTLGNFVLNPRAALLFVDFDRGDLLQLGGTVEIVWDGAAVQDLAGAERAWRVHVSHGWRRRAALPLRGMRADPTRAAPPPAAAGR